MTDLVLGPTPTLEERNWVPAATNLNVEALTCLGLAAEYNLRRLSTYEEREEHGDRIRIRSTESAIMLRFDDVGYFNSVYAPDESIVDSLNEIEEFFTGCPFACTLVGPPVEQPQRFAEVYLRRNWQPYEKYAWIHGSLRAMRTPSPSSRFEIRPPQLHERELFLQCYLESFGALPERRAAAIRNMRHLFEWPELHFLFALRDGEPAGIAMLLQVGEAALFCAGAVLPHAQNNGCHSALLEARIRLAHELECREIFSWTEEGSQSEKNMTRVGLSVVGVTETWSFHSGQ